MPNYGLVEGYWADGKYKFRKVEPDDWNAVVEHVKTHFLHDEPTSKLLGYSDEYGNEIGEIVKKMLVDDLSFLVEETDTKKVVAVRITYRHTPLTNFDDIPINSHQSKVLLRVVEVTERMAALFERFDLDEYAEFFMASCAPDHRRQGITSEMYARNMKFLAAEGFKLAKSVFTSPYTRAAVAKLGFKEVCRLDYHDLYDETGKLAFDPEELTSEHYAAIMVKEI
ncbi:unnamed protein product [Orchesella dallaii]|uniref:N-acetyltransferase domain-containing protein n=1 Tax=Orchesella dallaii TaxID=48710 RepID=A0ABP1S2F3_9HEXA